MKTVYIPKGETVHYESLATERLVVHGRLHVTYGVKAQSITGSGVIDAGSINADTVCSLCRNGKADGSDQRGG